jgi:myo-inositol 2-dehydrogenase/D-chiro-inositol 1-dehydrogenase
MTQQTNLTPRGELRVAVVGAGMMGADHIRRIATRTVGATVVAVVEPDAARANAAAALAPGSKTFSRIEDALEAGEIDAVVIATPGEYHEPVLFPALEAGLNILCEKPLTFDAESSRRVLEAEQKLDRPYIQVGFMRRFDPEYIQLKELIMSGDAGALLALRCVHRNPRVDAFTDSRMITDSVVHEIDVVPWLVGEPITAIEVKYPKQSSLAPQGLRDPQLVLLETESGVLADVEINVNVQFGYQVGTDAVFERGVAEIGRTGGLSIYKDGGFWRGEHQDFRTRFGVAYDVEVQRWVDAARRGTIDGPNAWDGYIANVVCEAGVKAQSTGQRVEIKTEARPAFYS